MPAFDTHKTLPTELWIKIIEHATCVDNVLEPDIYTHAELIGPLFNRDHHPALKRSLVTRRYLPRVSKTWYQLAIPFLYQSIWIGRSRVLASLSATLHDSACRSRRVDPPDGDDPRRRPVGAYTMRLDAAFSDQKPHRDICMENELDLLAAVISCLPNLVIVSFAIKTPLYDRVRMPNEVIDALCSVGKSLRVVDWTNDRLLPTTSDVHDLLKAAPSLRVYSCHALVASAGPEELHLPPLRSLTSLTICDWPIEDTRQDLIPSCLPSLRHITFIQSRDTAAPGLHIDPLHTLGANLTSVFLFITTFEHSSYFQAVASKISAWCPRLQRLGLSLPSWLTFPVRLQPPPIASLALRSRLLQAPDADYRYLLESLAAMSATAPSIKVVQFIDRYNVRDLTLKHRKTLRAGLQRLSTVRLEDHNGEAIS